MVQQRVEVMMLGVGSRLVDGAAEGRSSNVRGAN